MRRVFLTGITGTIGSALAERLLAHDDTQVVALVRARDDADLHARIAGMASYWGWAADDARLARILPLRGDVSQPHYGLDEDRRAWLADNTTHIIHCAASVKLNMTLQQALATTVTPTRTLLAFAQRGLRTGALQKMDIVSTVGVWGRTPGAMPERRLPEVQDFHNTYEAGKAEAERVLWREGDGLPLTVHRPSMVVGERGSGRVRHFQVFYHLCEFLSGRGTFGVMPGLGHTRLDTIPVDWVAAAIDWSSRHPDVSSGRIFHLCSGVDGAIPLPRLQQQVRTLWQTHGRPVPRLWQVRRRLLERLVPVIGAFAGAKGRRALRALPPVLAYLAEEQGFDNPQTALTLREAGLPVPAVDDYLEAVLRFYLQAQRRPEP